MKLYTFKLLTDTNRLVGMATQPAESEAEARKEVLRSFDVVSELFGVNPGNVITKIELESAEEPPEEMKKLHAYKNN